MPSTAAPRRRELIIWIAGLAAAGAACAWLAGDARFALPGSLAQAPAWLRQSPLDAMTALALRALVVVAAWLIITTLLALGTRAVGAVRAARLLDRVTPALVRRLASTAMSTAIGVGAGLPPAVAAPTPGSPAPAVASAIAAAGAEDRDEDVPLLRLVSPAARPVGTTVSAAPDRDRPDPSPPRAPDAHGAADDGTADAPPAAAAGPEPEPEPGPGPEPADDTVRTGGSDRADEPDHAAQREWTVRPGDHLWAIAEAVTTARDPTASERETARYWRRLIEENRSMLVDPGDPDLILPGQVVRLPGR